MKQHSVLFLLFMGIVSVIASLSSTGCANIIPPMGGPRDSLPPVLTSVRPVDSSRNFTAKRIVFEFDEFVTLDNVQQNLLVSPVPTRTNPVVESRLRTVTVTIKDTLEPNTTYSINFGNAIKDVNEGNPYKDFTYIFSTGPSLDSMKLTGKVIMAENGKSDSTLIVMLHTSTDDSAVIKANPRYIARTNGNGEFSFSNLPPATYTIYTLQDEGGQHKYTSPEQLFGFADSTVTTSTSPKPITLYAYKEEVKKETKPAAPARPQGNRGNTQQRDNRIKLGTSLSNNEQDLLSNLELSFTPAPLKSFDSTKVIFTNEQYQPLTGYYYIRDTSMEKITLVYKWTPATKYNLIIDKEFAEDTLGNKLPRTDTIEFTTKKENEYGQVHLRLLNIDMSKNPVLQFVQSDQVRYAFPLTSREFNRPLFQPGEYDLRLLFDENKNGKWDAGEFFSKHRQPEKVFPIPRKLTIKANWDNVVDITL